MGHVAVVTLLAISAVLSGEVVRERDLWDLEMRLNSLGLLSLDKALSGVLKQCIICLCVYVRYTKHVSETFGMLFVSSSACFLHKIVAKAWVCIQSSLVC